MRGTSINIIVVDAMYLYGKKTLTRLAIVDYITSNFVF